MEGCISEQDRNTLLNVHQSKQKVSISYFSPREPRNTEEGKTKKKLLCLFSTVQKSFPPQPHPYAYFQTHNSSRGCTEVSHFFPKFKIFPSDYMASQRSRQKHSYLLVHYLLSAHSYSYPVVFLFFAVLTRVNGNIRSLTKSNRVKLVKIQSGGRTRS